MRFFLLFLALPLATMAQDNYTILQKIIDAYQSDQSLSFNIHYQYYENKEDRLPTDSMHFQLSQQGKNYLIQSEQLDMMHFNGKSIWANHLEQQIIVSEAKVDSKPSLGIDLKTLKEFGESQGLHLVECPADEGLKGLCFEAPEVSNSKIEMIYDPKTYLLRSCSIQTSIKEEEAIFFTPNNNTRMEIIYSDYQIKQQPFPYSTQRYFVQKGGQRHLTKAWESYDLVEIQ